MGGGGAQRTAAVGQEVRQTAGENASEFTPAVPVPALEGLADEGEAAENAFLHILPQFPVVTPLPTVAFVPKGAAGRWGRVLNQKLGEVVVAVQARQADTT